MQDNSNKILEHKQGNKEKPLENIRRPPLQGALRSLGLLLVHTRVRLHFGGKRTLTQLNEAGVKAPFKTRGKYKN